MGFNLKFIIPVILFFLIVPATATDLDWTRVTASADWSARTEHATCSFDDKLWVIGGLNASGYQGDVWYSTDGETWTCSNYSAFSGRGGHAAIVLDDTMYVIGGYNGTTGGAEKTTLYDVWSSTDGATWTLETDTPAWKITSYGSNPTGLAYMGYGTDASMMWITGGYQYYRIGVGPVTSNDVYTSTDGANWTDIGDLPQYASFHTGWAMAQSPQMSLTLIGGVYKKSTSTEYQYPSGGTAYSSYTGETWSTMTTTAGWDARANFSVVNFDNALVLMGGENYNSLLKRDVWVSQDEGATWSSYSDAGWAIRQFPQAVVFNDTIWVMGGGGSTTYLNDVWMANITSGSLPESKSDDESGAGIQYPPHSVKFKIINGWGSPVSGATVTAVPVETTYGSWSWIADLFGIDNDVNIAGSTMTGTTGADGALSFVMMPEIQYQLTITKGEDSNDMLLYPSNTEYIFPLGSISWFDGGEDINAVITTNVTTAAINETYQGITVTGEDTSGHITGGTVFLNVTDPDNLNQQITVDSYAIPAGSNFTHTFEVTDYSGDSYFVNVDMEQSDYETYNKSFGVTFQVEPVNPLGLTNFELMFISMVIILCTGCVFTATTSYHGPLLTCFVGWVLYFIGWMAQLGTSAVMLLSAGTALSVFIIIAVRKEAV